MTAISSHRRGAAWLCLVAAGASGCAPNVALAPTPSVSSGEWRTARPPHATTSVESGWAAFGSPTLNNLVARARAANSDVRVAAARIVQARGDLKVARSASLPTIVAAASAGALTGGEGELFDRRDEALGLDVAYDLDLFGYAAAGGRSARARLAASGHDRDAVALAVESDVARAFFQFSALSGQLDLLGRALDNARELDRIIGVRAREGVATRYDSGLQAVEVARIQAEISRLAEARDRTRNALAVLVGEEAPSFDVEAATLTALAPPLFEPSQPAELVSRRPDVKAAEARIAAANGDVDRARAAFLPGLSISAGAIFEGAAGGPVGLALSTGSSLLASIFDGGRLNGNLLSAGGAQQEAAETYRKALLVSLADAEDAMTGLDRSRHRETLLRETLSVAHETARIARRQYVEGAADLLTVLDAERNALDVENAHILAVQDQLNAAVDLFKAIGGHPVARPDAIAGQSRPPSSGEDSRS